MIRPEPESDRQAIWSVNLAAFDTEAEAELVDALRDGGFNEVSLRAEVEGQIVGHILFLPLTVITESGTVDACHSPRWLSYRVIRDKGSEADSSKRAFGNAGPVVIA